MRKPKQQQKKKTIAQYDHIIDFFFTKADEDDNPLP
jgi:hypothetical protein